MAASPSTSARQGGYSAFGLSIVSELALPELPEAAFELGVSADVHIRLGAVPSTLEGAREVEPGVLARPGVLLIDAGESRFLVREGREIVVHPGNGAADRDVRLYLLGSAMGAILHQRGMLPLHANAIEIEGRVVAFAGASGAGKSTLAAYFHDRGHRVLCDDVCAVSFDGTGQALAWPGIPRIKLWGDALAALGRNADGLQPVWRDVDKYAMPVAAVLAEGPLPLHRIYLLQAARVGPPAIRRVSGAEAIDGVLSNTYRKEFVVPLEMSTRQFENAVGLLRTVEVFAADRHWGLTELGASYDLLRRHMAT